MTRLACEQALGQLEASSSASRLKPLLVQCAPKASTRYESDDYFARRYRRIKARRGHKRAVVAVARMMLACIYRTLSDGVKFDPTDREVEGDARDGHAAGDCAARAIELLAALGYDVSSLKTPA